MTAQLMKSQHRSSLRYVLAVAGVIVSAPVLLTGCSGKVIGLATSGNMNVIYLATAANDILLQEKVAIYQSPQCTVTNKIEYNCKGKTTTGQDISVSVPDASIEDPIMTLTVGGKQLYQGSVLEVIKKNAQVAK